MSKLDEAISQTEAQIEFWGNAKASTFKEADVFETMVITFKLSLKILKTIKEKDDE